MKLKLTLFTLLAALLSTASLAETREGLATQARADVVTLGRHFVVENAQDLDDRYRLVSVYPLKKAGEFAISSSIIPGNAAKLRERSPNHFSGRDVAFTVLKVDAVIDADEDAIQIVIKGHHSERSYVARRVYADVERCVTSEAHQFCLGDPATLPDLTSSGRGGEMKYVAHIFTDKSGQFRLLDSEATPLDVRHFAMLSRFDHLNVAETRPGQCRKGYCVGDVVRIVDVNPLFGTREAHLYTIKGWSADGFFLYWGRNSPVYYRLLELLPRKK